MIRYVISKDWIYKSSVSVLYFIIFIVSPLSSQTISGTIHDALTQEPIIGASITSAHGDLNFGTITDENGFFLLNITKEIQVITVSSVGYKKHRYRTQWQNPTQH
jgi:hypothetical protein